jgi:2-polyprenyl-6-methoxyphenol hydroxylase-like FAD-dependent oxidoreductase
MSEMRIAVVGGGPVGLVFAHQVSEKQKANVVVFEKRKYSRKQILLISKSSYNALPKLAQETLFKEHGHPGCFQFAPPKDRMSRCYTDPESGKRLPFLSVRTMTLEAHLMRAIHKEKNIKLVRNAVDSVVKKFTKGYYITAGGKKYGPFDIVVGCDGANSYVRREVLKADFKPNPYVKTNKRVKFYGAVFNFDTRGLDTKGVFKSPTPEHVAKVNAGKAQNEWRFFHGRGNYYMGLPVTAEEASEINQKRIPKLLQSKIDKVCKTVTPVGKTCNMSHLSHAAAFEITPMVASKFSNGSGVYLIGDAAMTTHYFTGSGFNIGVDMAVELAKKVPLSSKKFNMLMNGFVKKTASRVNQIWK